MSLLQIKWALEKQIHPARSLLEIRPKKESFQQVFLTTVKIFVGMFNFFQLGLKKL